MTVSGLQREQARREQVRVGGAQRRRGGAVGARGLEEEHQLAAAGEGVQHAAQQLLRRVEAHRRAEPSTHILLAELRAVLAQLV